ncbi:MAG: SDR family oxidoreductase [Bryobacterales bacterium]|nr:SDR family oxidoreductase [Bryobacteraceae bacterium]MDW8354945.1 SDR family oxidoreductase [Bryobacterales bacterium]
MKILVIGGTLFIGRRLVARLLEQGHEVAVLHRKSAHDLDPRVSNLAADRNDPSAVRAALQDRRFDAVFDNVYDWGRGTTAEQVEATARACGDRIQRYIFMSSVAAYGEGLDHREEDELAPQDHPEPYVRNKAASERALFRMHREEGLPVVTLRPPFVYGPGNPFYREAFFWDRMRDGRPIVVPDGGARLMQFVHVDDLVSVCLKVLEAPQAVGHAFNVANPRPVTQLEAIEAMARAAGYRPELVFAPRAKILECGGQALGTHLYFGEYFDLPPITMCTEKVKRMLGFRPIDFAEGLRRTYAWYAAQPPRRPDYSFEDRLLAQIR